MADLILTPRGRFVQGSMTLKPKTDDNNNPVMERNDPTKQVKECFIALAVAKNDPDWPRFWGEIHNRARKEFPHLFDAQGNCLHPRFAFKVQDGDGVDKNGRSVAGKPGFAGHWIVKMATRYAPRCFYEGKFDPMQAIQDPDPVIKRGYYIRAGVDIAGNGVAQNAGNAVPGMFISPSLISLVAVGEEIVSGPDAAAFFGAAPMASFVGPAPAAAGVPLPAPAAAGVPLPPAPAPLPAPAAAGVPLPPAPAPLPPAPVAAGFTMTPAAMGATREALLAAGWTDETLLSHGMMTRNG